MHGLLEVSGLFRDLREKRGDLTLVLFRRSAFSEGVEPGLRERLRNRKSGDLIELAYFRREMMTSARVALGEPVGTLISASIAGR